MSDQEHLHTCSADCIADAIEQLSKRLDALDTLARRLAPVAADIHSMAASLAVLATAAARREAPMG